MKAIRIVLPVYYLVLATLHAGTISGTFTVTQIVGNAGNENSASGQITVGDSFQFSIPYNGNVTDSNASTSLGTFGGAISGGGTLTRLSGTGWNPNSATLFGGGFQSTNDTGGQDTANFSVGSSSMPTVLGIPFTTFGINFVSTNLSSIVDTGAGQTVDSQLGVALSDMDSLTSSQAVIHFTNNVSDNLWVYGGATPTPEPRSIALLMGGAVFVVGRFRRRRGTHAI